MPFRFTFGILGEDQVDRTFADIEDRVHDWRPAWSALRDRFLVLEQRQFATQGTYSGGWSPLSPKYAAWKHARFPGRTILRRTDELYRSLTDGPQIDIREPMFMRLGTAVAHGAFHQSGTENMPRRRPVELPASERQNWVKVLQSYATTGKVTGVGAVP